MQALDIIRSLSEQNGSNDMAEAVALLGEHFRHKYISPIKQNFDEKCRYCDKNPSPRVNLLRAFLPFVKDGKAIEKMTDIMIKYDALQEIIREKSNKDTQKKEKTQIIDKKNLEYLDYKSNAIDKNTLLFIVLAMMISKI